MANTVLPTVNFDANPGLDEFQYLHQTYSEEFRLRSQIAAGVQIGIVDFSGDPATAPYEGRPLLVTLSALNPQTIDIAPGYAVTPSHLLINIDSTIPSIPLPGIAADKVYIVAVEYKLVESAQQRINRFGNLTEVRLERPSNNPPGNGASTLLNAITVVDINDYKNLNIFPQERLDNSVVLAVITVRQSPTTGALTLSFDLSRDTYSFNRPWFSTVDVEHRSRIGSGAVSDNNPHGLTLQDLSSAGLTLYQQLKPSGGVVAKDFTYYGYPGTFCTETISLSRLTPDYTGAITASAGAPRLGGAYFVSLQKRPVRTGSLYFSGRPWLPVPYEWLEGTNIIVLGSLEQPLNFEDDLIFEYFSVDALEVNNENLTQGMQTLTVKNPIQNQEFIVSGGQALNELAQTTLSLPALLGPIKKKYQVFCDKVGALLLSPQPLVALIKVQDLVGRASLQLNQTPSGGKGVPIIVGLTRANERTTVGSTTFDLDLRLEITGLSEDNTAQTETIVFKASQWKDQDQLLNVEEPLQIRSSKKKFMVLTSVRLTNTSAEPPNAGTDAVLSIWADSMQASVNKELASVASFFWTGVTAIQVKDERQISTTLQKINQKQTRSPNARPEQDLASVQEFLSVILKPALTPPEKTARLRLLESNDDRVYAETWNKFSDVDASASLVLSTISSLVNGQTLRIAPGKYLKIWTPDPNKPNDAPNPSKGDVAIGSSDIVFRTNLIATINDPMFDSTWFATLGTGTNPAINLSRPLAYPEGFVLSKRINLNFSGNYTSIGQYVKFKLNGTQIGPVNYVASTDPNVTSHTKTLEAIRDAINAVSSITKVSAVVLTGQNIVALNGGPDGEIVAVTQIEYPVSAPSMTANEPLLAFAITQPSGGVLPTSHLPERYPSSGKKWEYLSRPLLWGGAFLEATISFTNNNVAAISDGDQVEIAPGKILTARNGSTTIDPTRGDFLVDTSSDALAKTLKNIASTINNPVWSSGVQASIVDNHVVLRIAGLASAKLLQIAQTASNLWVLSPYQPVGPGPSAGHGFIKALRPLDVAEWRYILVPNTGDLLTWSSWEPMMFHSETSFSVHVPPGQSLYCVQFRLRGRTHEPNSFSLYQIIPHENSSTIDSLTNLVTPLKAEVEAARGTTTSLSNRIASVVNPNGTAIQDSDLVSAKKSSIFTYTGSNATLKERLDIADTFIQWLAGGLPNFAKPGLITPFSGMPNQLWSGPANHLAQLTSDKIRVGGTESEPLVFTIQGYQYVYMRQVELSLAGQTQVGTYYIKAQKSTELGYKLVDGLATSAAVANSNTLTDSTKNFANLGANGQILPGHLVEFTNIQIQGQNYCTLVQSVTATTITVTGGFPRDLIVGEPYRVWAPRELDLSLTATKQEGKNILYLGEVDWKSTPSGSLVAYSIDAVRGYRYRNKYDSGVTSKKIANPTFSHTFQHNLGFLPGHFTLYLYKTETDVEPKIVASDDLVVKTSANTLTIRNRYQNQVGKDYDGIAITEGYFRLVID